MSAKAGWCAKRDPAERPLRMASAVGGVVEGAHAHPLGEDAAGVDVGDGQLRLEREALGLGQQIAELVDQPLPVPGEVGGALARPGGGIDIGGDRTRRTASAQSRCALVRLADGDVRGREVGEDQRPGQRARVEGGDGAQKSSQISTWKRKSARSSAAKIRSVPNGAVAPGHPDRRARRRRGRARTSASRNIRGSWAGSSSAPRRGSRPRAIATAQL